MKLSRKAILIAAGLAALALGILAGSYHPTTEKLAETAVAVVLPAPRVIGDFTLSDQDGAPYTAASLHGHWTLLFAGFTHCPDVCPTTLGVMKAVEKRLPAGLAPLQMIFLSVDPERDTPDQLKRYVRFFSDKLVGLTGPTAQIDRLTAGLGLAYMKVPGASPKDYSVDHSAALALVDPEGRVAAYFQPPHQVESLTADLVRLLGKPE